MLFGSQVEREDIEGRDHNKPIQTAEQQLQPDCNIRRPQSKDAVAEACSNCKMYAPFRMMGCPRDDLFSKAPGQAAQVSKRQEV